MPDPEQTDFDDYVDFGEYAGTCGTLIYGSINRWDLERCKQETETIRKRGMEAGVGVIVTSCANNTPEHDANMVAAGWVKTLTYKGQYTIHNYEEHRAKEYPMSHWALVLKPWEE